VLSHASLEDVSRALRLWYRHDMPTVLRGDGLRVVVYPNDHPPAHVHVLGPGWAVVINLIGPEVRETINCSDRDVRRAMQLVARHRDAIMEAWRRIHD
jgi:hypothetical protein